MRLNLKYQLSSHITQDLNSSLQKNNSKSCFIMFPHHSVTSPYHLCANSSNEGFYLNFFPSNMRICFVVSGTETHQNTEFGELGTRCVTIDGRSDFLTYSSLTHSAFHW